MVLFLSKYNVDANKYLLTNQKVIALILCGFSLLSSGPEVDFMGESQNGNRTRTQPHFQTLPVPVCQLLLSYRIYRYI